MGDGRTEKVTFTCTPDLKEILIEWAADERRSVSNLVEGLIADAITARQAHEPPTSGKGRGEKGGKE